MDRSRNGGAGPECGALFRLGRRPADPVSSSLLVVPWLVYLHTGDKRILDKCYDGMKRWEAYLERVSDQDIVKFSYFGDWAGPVTASDPESGASARIPLLRLPILSLPAYYLNCVLLENIARVLGKGEDADAYQAMKGRILNRFNQKFFTLMKISMRPEARPPMSALCSSAWFLRVNRIRFSQI